MIALNEQKMEESLSATKSVVMLQGYCLSEYFRCALGTEENVSSLMFLLQKHYQHLSTSGEHNEAFTD